MTTIADSFKSRTTLRFGGREIEMYRLDALSRAGFKGVETLPYSIRVLLENLVRCEDGNTVSRRDIEAVANWDPKSKTEIEIAFRPSRVLLQDFTGVPAVVDLAAMREAFAKMGGDPSRINPMQPVDLVIDHSVQVDVSGSARAFEENVRQEFERNQERYEFFEVGTKGVPQHARGAAGNGNCSSSELGIPCECCVHSGDRWEDLCVSRFSCGNGFAYHDDQWPWRSCVGRWGH